MGVHLVEPHKGGKPLRIVDDETLFLRKQEKAYTGGENPSV
jgi:hypothetical protein